MPETKDQDFESIRYNKETEDKENVLELSEGEVLILMGPPASGKSYFTEQYFPKETVIGTDWLRAVLTNSESNQLVNKNVFEYARQLLESRVKEGKISVIDATNLSIEERKKWADIAHAEGRKVTLICFEYDENQVRERNQKRRRRLSDEVMKKMLRRAKSARRFAELDENMDRVVSVNPDEQWKVCLPSSEISGLREQKKTEDQYRAIAKEVITIGEETGFKESPEVRFNRGDLLIFQESPNVTILSNKFEPSQIIDCKVWKIRAAAENDPEVLQAIIQKLVEFRTSRNLTTVIVNASLLPNPIEAKFHSTQLTTRALDKEVITEHTVWHMDNPSQHPWAQEGKDMVVVGDVQGCFDAAKAVIKETIKRNKESESEEKIIFVGDMADRGTQDARSVLLIYALVKAKKAMLVKGNHDVNLLTALKQLRDVESELSEEGLQNFQFKGVGSKTTQTTAKDLFARLQKNKTALEAKGIRVLDEIINMIEQAPVTVEWDKYVISHAGLPFIPRGEQISPQEEKQFTHGVETGIYGPRGKTQYVLNQAAVKDSDQMAIGGHSHAKEVKIDEFANTLILDNTVEMRGKLHAFRSRDEKIITYGEPKIIELYKKLNAEELPKGRDLVDFVYYLKTNGLIELKHGEGKYKGLITINYTNLTELENLWELYPSLRNFRGLIIDTEGNIVARPFKKTHKAGVEISLEKLNIVPEKVFEKANGSMIILYNRDGAWHTATKASFENETYTQTADALLKGANLNALLSDHAYLFELILPEDAHIIDYEDKREMVLLNAVHNESGKELNWSEIEKTASMLGLRTATDFTESSKIQGKTIAELYEWAQQPGNANNLEGFMAVYTDPTTNERVTVKVKAHEYDKKKFVRDYLNFDRLLKHLDLATMQIPPESLEPMLGASIDDPYIRGIFESRMRWLSKIRDDIINQLKIESATIQEQFGSQPKWEGRYVQAGKNEENKKQRQDRIGLIKALLQSPEDLAKNPIFMREFSRVVMEKVAVQENKRGKNYFYIVPE